MSPHCSGQRDIIRLFKMARMGYRYQIYDPPPRSDPRETRLRKESCLQSRRGGTSWSQTPSKFVGSQEKQEWGGYSGESAGGLSGRSTKDNPPNGGSSNYGAGDPSIICIHFALSPRSSTPCESLSFFLLLFFFYSFPLLSRNLLRYFLRSPASRREERDYPNEC